VILPDLFHWSPAENRERIRREGLQIYESSMSGPIFGEEIGMPYVCLAPDPLCAWRLSGDMGWGCEFDIWDLYQVKLGDRDEVHVMAEFGHTIKEVRVHNTIPFTQVFYIASREQRLGRRLDRPLKSRR
jgi:hypothetical protein